MNLVAGADLRHVHLPRSPDAEKVDGLGIFDVTPRNSLRIHQAAADCPLFHGFTGLSKGSGVYCACSPHAFGN